MRIVEPDDRSKEWRESWPKFVRPAATAGGLTSLTKSSDPGGLLASKGHASPSQTTILARVLKFLVQSGFTYGIGSDIYALSLSASINNPVLECSCIL